MEKKKNKSHMSEKKPDNTIPRVIHDLMKKSRESDESKLKNKDCIGGKIIK